MTVPTLEDILIEECGLDIDDVALDPEGVIKAVRVQTPEVHDLLRTLARFGVTVEQTSRIDAVLHSSGSESVRVVVAPSDEEWLRACCEAILQFEEPEAHDSTASQAVLTAGPLGFNPDSDYDPKWWQSQAAPRLNAARQWLERGRFGEPMAAVRPQAEVLAMLVQAEVGNAGDWRPPMQWILMMLALNPAMLESARALAGPAPVRVTAARTQAERGRG